MPMKLKHPGKKWGRQLFQAGQHSHFTAKRKNENRRTRRAYKDYCHGLTNMIGCFEEEDDLYYHLEEINEPAPLQRAGIDQADYLAPIVNFLAAHVNQPWSKTFSKLCQRMDRNSTCGDHVWLHMKHFIETHPERIEESRDKEIKQHWKWGKYFVDEDGILRRLGKEPGPRPKYSARRIEDDRNKAIDLMRRSPYRRDTDKFYGGWTADPITETRKDYWTLREVKTYSQARIVICEEHAHWGVPDNKNQYRPGWRPAERLSNGYAEIYWSLCEEVRNAITHES